MELANDARWLRSVFENDDRQHAVKCFIAKGQFFQSPDDVELRVVPGWITKTEIDSDILRMIEPRFKATFTGACVQHAASRADFCGNIGDETSDRCFKGVQSLEKS